MDELLTEQARRGTFGRRRVAPRVGIVEPKPSIRSFLADTFEDLGFIPQGWADAREIVPALSAIAPDLVVIVMSGDVQLTEKVLKLLATTLFRGKVMIVGGSSMPALTHVQQRGAQLGLAMLPPLNTPFRPTELKARLAGLLPAGPPPALPVDFAEALGNNWLELWYQPKIDPRRLSVDCAEALIRLRHPTWGIVPPACFLPEKSDPHFRALSDFVILKAMADWTRFAIDCMPIEIAVNLPVAVLADPDFVERLCRRLPDHPAFERLVVEIDSSELIDNTAHVRRAMRGLGSRRIGLSIDNLGTECSSLAGLEGFPVMELKIARTVVSGCANDRLKRALCGTILDIARRLGARTVAEGVETRSDLHAAREMGFDLVQGFLFGKPMEAQKFARTLRRPVTVQT